MRQTSLPPPRRGRSRPGRSGRATGAVWTAALAAVVLLLGVVPAQAQSQAQAQAERIAPPPSVGLRPGALPAGEGPRVPWLVNGDTLVDGEVRVRLPGSQQFLLGASGEGYVVGLTARDDTPRLLRVLPDGTRRRLGGINPYASVLSGDGTRIIESWVQRRGARVRVHDATTGKRLAQRRFPRAAQVLDADTDRVLVGLPARTVSWAPGAGTVTRVVAQAGYRASLRADRLATYTGDPYAGGCTVVRRLSAPRTVLWRSCEDRVAVFAPGGGRMFTIPILADGLGTRDLSLRNARTGELQVAYHVRGWFGAVDWEAPGTVLLQANGTRRTATVRCKPVRCERASRVVPTTMPRVVAGS